MPRIPSHKNPVDRQQLGRAHNFEGPRRLLQEQGEGPLLCWTLSTTLSDIVRKWAYSTVFLDEPTLAAIAWRLDMEFVQQTSDATNVLDGSSDLMLAMTDTCLSPLFGPTLEAENLEAPSVDTLFSTLSGNLARY
ncbi:hypothetical protein B0O80DRAFT_500537 [Mortierella sp. GBAus27b]|nr:hypothetical protein B0O80DRAFT_500537 [Mortierella sp. GBAus27b]